MHRGISPHKIKAYLRMKTVDIFIKSYRNDFWLLYIALKTIERNVTGYNNVVLLIPNADKDLFDTRELPPRTLIHYVDDSGNGYLRQQVFKLQAHKYCDAEFVLFADSDCFWDHKIDLQEFVADGKPEILYTDWSKVGDAICWKEPTEKVLGEEAPFEGMRRNCMIVYKKTLENISLWRPNIETTVMNMKAFSEFNLISNYAYKFEKQNYSFVNTDDWEYVPPKGIQVWSHSDKNGDDLHKTEYIRLLESIMVCFDVPVPKK